MPGTAKKFKFGSGLAVTDEGSGVARIDVAGVGGTNYLVGSGAPGGALGGANDLYEDMLNGDLYQKKLLGTTPTFRSSSAVSQSSVPSVSVPKPSGTVAGDTLILFGYASGGAPPDPSGWQKLASDVYNSPAVSSVWAKVADGNETWPLVINASAGTQWMTFGCLAYSSSGGVDAFANYGSVQTISSPVAPSVVAGYDNEAIVALLVNENGGISFGAPSGFTTRVVSSNNGSVYAADKLQASAGPSGTATIATGAGSVKYSTYSAAIKGAGIQPTWTKIRSGAISGGLALISNTVLSSAGIFDIQNIPQTYNDLVCTLIGRLAYASNSYDDICWLFNNDSGANYSRQYVRGNGNTTQAGEHRNVSLGIDAGFLPTAAQAAGLFGIVNFVIPGYASNAWIKTALFENYCNQIIGIAGAADYFAGGGLWNNTAPINRIQVKGNISPFNFVAGSQLRIYGRA